MNKRFFITGTDTDIGKTLVSCSLLQEASQAGYRVAGYKPVATGCKITPIGLRSDDALALMSSSNVKLSYNQVNPFSFIEPTSPNIASQYEGLSITNNILSSGLHALENIADWIVIEGAGGWFTPLGENFSYADWVVKENIPVILVVGMKLGCINHALLTALAVRSASLYLVGWIANYCVPIISRPQDYLISLKKRLSVPLLGKIPWLQEGKTKTTTLSHYIDISILE